MNEPRHAIFSSRVPGGSMSGPLYLALKRNIEQAIADGVLNPGEALPSERDIAAMADVSRVTVRKAVQDLVEAGLLVQRHGSGTFVAQRVGRVEQSLSSLTSFTEDMARRGLTVESVWLDRGIHAPSPEETMVLGLAANDTVVRIGRLRKTNGIPMAIERATVSCAFLPDPTEIGDSLYVALRKRGNHPVRAVQRISAALLEPQDAELLEVAAGSPSLNIVRISYLPSGQAIEFTRSRYRADTYDFVAELRLGEN
ncbi:MAG TPA: GntR family transcriptional regulator [Rhizobiaceae bacterium]|nr:GntR family transcriptional regulator [Rhizobiaceae bacterium]